MTELRTILRRTVTGSSRDVKVALLRGFLSRNR
jgi:hypothetical protein